MLFYPLSKAALSLMRLRLGEARYRWSAFKGRARELLS
jgi:hypothetical protein